MQSVIHARKSVDPTVGIAGILGMMLGSVPMCTNTLFVQPISSSRTIEIIENYRKRWPNSVLGFDSRGGEFRDANEIFPPLAWIQLFLVESLDMHSLTSFHSPASAKHSSVECEMWERGGGTDHVMGSNHGTSFLCHCRTLTNLGPKRYCERA